MCNNHPTHRHGIQCILPPYITDELHKSGDATAIQLAAEVETQAATYRGARAYGFIADLEKLPKNDNLKRRVYDAQNRTTGEKIVLNEKKPDFTQDPDAQNVFHAAKDVWTFYKEMFGRNSIDNLGMVIRQVIHYDKKYANAFWDGEKMIYGDGDGVIFGNFTEDLDIIGHEMTHGVMQYEANLNYAFEAGALNESFSDVFGTLIKQRVLGQDVKQASWLIGEKCVKGDYALRSMKAPGAAYRNHPLMGTDPQPAHMAQFKMMNYNNDNGGVHINSGIPNHAFYVTARNLGGNAWEKAGRIWYEAMTNTLKLEPHATFITAKNQLVWAAQFLYGKGSLEQKAVLEGWKEVGVE